MSIRTGHENSLPVFKDLENRTPKTSDYQEMYEILKYSEL